MYLFYYSISVFLFCFIRCLSFCFRDAKIRIFSGTAKIFSPKPGEYSGKGRKKRYGKGKEMAVKTD